MGGYNQLFGEVQTQRGRRKPISFPIPHEYRESQRD